MASWSKRRKRYSKLSGTTWEFRFLQAVYDPKFIRIIPIIHSLENRKRLLKRRTGFNINMCSDQIKWSWANLYLGMM